MKKSWSSLRVIFACFILVIFLILGWLSAKYLPLIGSFGQPTPVAFGSCKAIDGFMGPEDLALDRERGWLFISDADWRHLGTDKVQRGGIYLLDLNDSAPPRLVSPHLPHDFQPHGIGLWKEPSNGKARLFVVNHPTRSGYSLAHPKAGGHRIELFDILPSGDLDHVESLNFDELVSPNDVAPVGPRQFFVSNDQGYHGAGFMNFLEDRLLLPFANLVYFDGEQAGIVGKHLNYANGLNVSQDGNQLYVNEIIDRTVSIYRIQDHDTGALKLEHRFKTGMSPDNVEVSSEGELILAGFHNVNHFIRYQHDPAYIAPAQIIRLGPKTGQRETLYYNEAGQYSTATVGIFYKDRLVMGGLFEDHLLLCDKN